MFLEKKTITPPPFLQVKWLFPNGRQIVNFCHRYKMLFVIVATWPMSLDLMHRLFTNCELDKHR